MKSEEVLKRYKNVSSNLVQLLSSLTEKQLNTKVDNTGWTVAQVGEHLNMSYAISGVLQGKVKDVSRDPLQKIPEIERLFLNFDIKMESPKEIIPPQGLIKKEKLLDDIQNKTNSILDFSKHADLSKLCLDFEIPEYGAFTRFEWIGFNTAHTTRHIHQIEQIIKIMES